MANTQSSKHLLIAAALVVAFVLAPFSMTEARTTRGANVDQTCMQTAVDARETAIMAAFSSFNDDVEAALGDRKTALHDAWGLTDGSARNAAVKAAWKTWKTDHKAAFKDLKTARKSAWDTFKSTAKTTCSVTVPKDEALTSDAAGSVSL